MRSEWCRVVPSAVAGRHRVRLSWSPRAAPVAVDRAGLVEEGLDDPPGVLDAVLAGESGRVALQRVAQQPVGAENLCDQAILVNHAPGAVTPLDPELIEIGDSFG